LFHVSWLRRYFASRYLVLRTLFASRYLGFAVICTSCVNCFALFIVIFKTFNSFPYQLITTSSHHHIITSSHHHITTSPHHFAFSPNRFGLIYVLISGVNAFIISIANETPSGYAPNTRITTVIIPIPTP